VLVTILLATGSAVVSAADHPVPVDATGTPRENISFWYQRIHQHTDLTALGHPQVVVHYDPSTQAGRERLAVDRIHAATGAAAYRYVQMYYLPAVRRSMGVRMGRHPDWAFCSAGTAPATDTAIKPAADRWLLVDVNERPVIATFRHLLSKFKAAGWDGIFLDLAHRAFTQQAWDRASSCEHHPIVAGRPSADAYAALIPLARSMGLQVMVNEGAPSGVPSPLRPDPADPACRAAVWSRCHGLDDVARAATWILHEGSSNWPDDTQWQADLAGLTQDEQANRRPGRARVVAFGAYRGAAADQLEHTVYQWGVMKLAAVPAAFGTGTDRCGATSIGPTTPDCNRGGLAPTALVDLTLGSPLDAGPLRRDCAPDGWHCLWLRRYRDGLVAVDNTVGPTHADDVALTSDGRCVFVADAVTNAAIGGGCISHIDLALAGDRAQVLRYADQPPA